MIVQGSNAPIVLTFESDMSTILDIEISLFNTEKEFMHWSKADVIIESNKITLPITQKDSVKFPAGRCQMEIKWMDYDGKTNFAKNITHTVMERRDKTVMEGAR